MLNCIEAMKVIMTTLLLDTASIVSTKIFLIEGSQDQVK